MEKFANWRRGCLRSFESLSSAGAKYCYLNRISPASFGRLLSTRDSGDSLQLERFLAKLLREPLSKFTGAYHMGLDLNFGGLVNHTDFFDRRLKTCGLCIADGYHSTLHQLCGLEYCFIHGLELSVVGGDRLPSPGALPHTRFVCPLFQIWYKSNPSKWEAAKRPIWPSRDIPYKARAAVRHFIEENKYVERLAFDKRSNFCVSGVTGGTLAQREMIGKYILLERAPQTLCIGRENLKEVKVSASGDDIEKILQLSVHLFINLVNARRLEVFFAAQSPAWKATLDNFVSVKLAAHAPCKRSVEEQVKQRRCLRAGDGVWGQSSRYPNLEIGQYNLKLCRSLTQIEAIDRIFNADTYAEWLFSIGQYGQHEHINMLGAYATSGLVRELRLFCQRAPPPTLTFHPLRPSNTSHGREAWESLTSGGWVNIATPCGPLGEIIDKFLECEVKNLITLLASSSPEQIFHLANNAHVVNGGKPAAFVLCRVNSAIHLRYIPFAMSGSEKVDSRFEDDQPQHKDSLARLIAEIGELSIEEFSLRRTRSQRDEGVSCFERRLGAVVMS